MSTLFDVWNTIQKQLFPSFEQELDPLTKKEQEFIQVVTLLDLPSHMKSYIWRGFGRKRKSRLAMAKAFVAKSIYKLETTDMLIVYLKRLQKYQAAMRMGITRPSTLTIDFFPRF